MYDTFVLEYDICFILYHVFASYSYITYLSFTCITTYLYMFVFNSVCLLQVITAISRRWRAPCARCAWCASRAWCASCACCG